MTVAYDLQVAFKHGRRMAILEAYVVLGFLLWCITEALGAFRAITLAGLAVAWGIVGVGAAVFALRASKPTLRNGLVAELRKLRSKIKSLPAPGVALLAYFLFAVAILAAIAAQAAPNTWDSMTYHLSRVMHWQQDQSLDFYATAIQRQLSFGPLAEMAILHLQILAGNDRLANFVQLLAMLGCVVGATLAVERLGGSRRAQYFGALALLTLPMGILQATSTQNDYVLSLWCICFTVFALMLLDVEKRSGLVALTGAALGLAVLTKATAAFFVAWPGIWLAFGLVRRTRLDAWKALVAILGVAVLIAAPQSLRNLRLYGNPLGMTSGRELGTLANEGYTLPMLASNILRNVGLQLASPSEGLNRSLESIIQRGHAIIGQDVNDPRTTWHGLSFHVVFSMFEDSAGNPLHVLLAFAAFLLLPRLKSGRAVGYALCVTAGFLVFCLWLKWQPWNSRLDLPLLVLSMPLAAAVIVDRVPQPVVYAVGIILALAAVPYLIENPTRPLVGSNSIFLTDRLHQYFTNVPDDFATYDEAARMLSDKACGRVGLESPSDGREYLIWVTARTYSPTASIDHVLVKNPSRRYEIDATPCAIIVTYPVAEPTMAYHNGIFARAIATERFSLYLISGYAH